ncbi:hypothetical protein WICANDRAFT_32139 [Wickerhamomyces anomalus NRRL Y-366-8]|uniref:GDS1 winged helix domain-containing protein n=1 Tax=Wickerhamomyces anomalus (strain ATCC 58044 / CBS 1984 / NCYC 433 / NRRL Y-366-8) TaxID=683960 RepID=A0A1E3P1U2_WICAA|nr:uncharacterized protein WICANDRAFT_32139 [Wickerhamomyces anomalus NRRL Y-366-8]ODQ59313.1 hypothetical protein WICANDRAFT_32139 [Wickerhamomyces anomalus NRRL Y-366-8]
MALANRRPVAFPMGDSTATTSPAFKPRRLSLNSDNSKPNNSALSESIKEMTPEKSSSPEEFKDVSPTSTVATSVSSSSSKPPKEKKEKAEKGEKKHSKPSSRAPIATGISTTIPVTGERPKPTQHPSLDDDVLFAIFEILHERDEDRKGMTVKQICDILVEKHPKMATLSTKTSNLVSAKLNAYVKRVEKGEKALIYSLSREWADASPKRMVYVYRGLLAPDYYVHALAAIESQKSQEQSIYSPFGSLNDNDFSNTGSEMKRRATAFDLGVTKHTFADLQLDLTLPQLSIPYSAAPVTASLGLGSTLKSPSSVSKSYESPIISEYDFEEMDQFDEDDDEDGGHVKITLRNNKRSKSMSYLSSKKVRTLTAAAAAPRFSKVAVSPSPSAAAAAAALHAAALEGLSPAGSAVRDGFLTQDIETPEDISLAELDSLFT